MSIRRHRDGRGERLHAQSLVVMGHGSGDRPVIDQVVAHVKERLRMAWLISSPRKPEQSTNSSPSTRRPLFVRSAVMKPALVHRDVRHLVLDVVDPLLLHSEPAQ